MTVACPCELPKQARAVCVRVVLSADGCIILRVSLRLQFCWSVTVMTQEPALSPVAFWVVCMGLVFHEKEKPPLPPEAVACAVPLLPPKQETLVKEDAIKIGACAGITTTIA